MPFRCRRRHRLAGWFTAAFAVVSLSACGEDGPTTPPPNRAPVAVGTISARTIEVGESAAFDVSGSFSDPDGDALTYTASSSDVSVATAGVSGSTLTVGALTASDAGGLTATQSFDVTVPNQAPAAVGTIPARTVQVGDAATLDVSGSFSDPDGDALTYTASSSDVSVATAGVSGSTLTVGALTAADAGGLTATQSFEVTVPNQAPVAVGTISARTVQVGESAAFDVSASFSDPDGDALTYTASSSDSSVATAGVTDSTLTVDGLSRGTATITVTATDAGGFTAEQSFDVTVPNRAPAAVGTISARTVQVGESAAFDVSASFSDPDGDALTYTASSSDSSVATAGVSGSTLTVDGLARGTATITVTATDAGGLTAEQSFDVTVPNPNRAPAAVGTISARTVQVGDADTLDLSASFSDPDGDALTYTASSSDSSVATPAVTDSTLTVGALAKGTATITVTAADTDGLTATQSFDVTVPNRAPAAVGTISARTVQVGDADTLVVSANFSDPDGDALTYTASRPR
ncbi:MAG: Ig-like domain-containing protein [Gemmatimonadetes bacterium]|nr:Ig-like domain-containing protein [Gemmatimonadota bacterium]